MREGTFPVDRNIVVDPSVAPTRKIIFNSAKTAQVLKNAMVDESTTNSKKKVVRLLNLLKSASINIVLILKVRLIDLMSDRQSRKRWECEFISKRTLCTQK